LFRLLDATAPTATWQREVARALQTWANVSGLNVRLVSDDGSPTGTAGSPQGDSRFGDIRVAAAPEGSYLAYTYYPAGTVLGGDSFLNPNYSFRVGDTYDLYSVMLHEFGHSFGLDHSSGAVMDAYYHGVLSGLTADDVAGIQALYGARLPDAYDAASPNDTTATATSLGTDSSGQASVTADLTTLADLDYFRLTVPAGGDGTLTVTLDAGAISLLAPRLCVYDANGALVGSAEAGYGGVVSVPLTGLTAGDVYYVAVDGTTTDEFGQGAYKLTAKFGGLSGGGSGGGGGTGGLPADRYEADETPAAAAGFGSINSTSQTGLTVNTATDVDYYAFTAKTSAKYVVRTSFTGANGDLGLAVYDANLNLVGSSTGTGDGDAVTLSLAAGRRYYVKVFGVDGATNAYDLAIAKQGGKPAALRRMLGAHQAAEAGHGTYPDASFPDDDGDEVATTSSPGPAEFRTGASVAEVSVEGLDPAGPARAAEWVPSAVVGSSDDPAWLIDRTPVPPVGLVGRAARATWTKASAPTADDGPNGPALGLERGWLE
jgi:Matrixin